MRISAAFTLRHRFPEGILGYKKYYWAQKIHIKWQQTWVIALNIKPEAAVTEKLYISNSLPAARYKNIY